MKVYAPKYLWVLSNDEAFETTHSSISQTQCAHICDQETGVNIFRFSLYQIGGISGDCVVSSRGFAAPMTTREAAVSSGSLYKLANVLHVEWPPGNVYSSYLIFIGIVHYLLLTYTIFECIINAMGVIHN